MRLIKAIAWGFTFVVLFWMVGFVVVTGLYVLVDWLFQLADFLRGLEIPEPVKRYFPAIIFGAVLSVLVWIAVAKEAYRELDE